MAAQATGDISREQEKRRREEKRGADPLKRSVKSQDSVAKRDKEEMKG